MAVRATKLSLLILLAIVFILGLLTHLHFHVTTFHLHSPTGPVQHQVDPAILAPDRRRDVVATPPQGGAGNGRTAGGAARDSAHPILPTAAGAWEDERPKHTGPHRVYCMVPFVWPHPEHEGSHNLNEAEVKKGSFGPGRYREIMATWGPRCDMIEFFIDHPEGTPPWTDLPSNVIPVNMTRYLDESFDPLGVAPKTHKKVLRYGKHIWEKVWRSWIWVRRNRAHLFDWFVKVDDDSFLFVENIRWFVHSKGWNPLDAHYFGHKLYHRMHDRKIPLIAGATTVFSRAALEIVATMYEQMPKGIQLAERGKCEDRALASEEVSTAVCLNLAGLEAEPAVDELNREMIYLFFPSAQFLDMKRPPLGHRDEGWYWKGKPANTPDMHNCCSTHPIAFHNMKRNDHFHDMERYFYNPSTSTADMDKDFFRRKERVPEFIDHLAYIKGNLTEVRPSFSRVGPKVLPTIPKSKKRQHPATPKPAMSCPKRVAPPAAERKVVRHDWIRASDTKFVALGAYRLMVKGKLVDAILGDGKLPVKRWYDNGQHAATDLACQWKHSAPKAAHPPRIEFMHSTNGSAQYTQYGSREIPFSAQLGGGNQLHTQIVYCEVPSGASGQRLTGLKDTSSGWTLDLSKTRLVDTTAHGTIPRSASCPPRVTMCMNPIYKLKSSQWIVEWIEYHRAVGVDHIHVYRVDEESSPVADALATYRDEGFLTLHDWSYRASGQLTASSHTYEHAKYLMLTDCALRSRGLTEFIAQNDVDELLAAPGGPSQMESALMWMHGKAKENANKIGFSIASETVTSVYRKPLPPSSGHLLLEQFDAVEPKCVSPYNCGQYHRGRKKYLLYIAGSSVPTPLWVHAVSRDYTRSDHAMVAVPPNKLHVRHYQGWWYTNRDDFKDGTLVEKYSPIDDAISAEILKRIHNSKAIDSAYKFTPVVGPDWVKTHYNRSNLYPASAVVKKYTCEPEEASANRARFHKRNSEWWSHSACADSLWMDVLPRLLRSAMDAIDSTGRSGDSTITVFDIGCNKGYASMDYLDAIAPWSKLNPASLYTAMEKTMKEENFFVDKRCGVCNDCRKPLADDERVAQSAQYTAGVKSVNVYCYEPAPSTFKMLQQVKARLDDAVSSVSVPADKANGKWILKNLGFTNTSGMLFWHPSCATAIGSELCSIVAPDTPNAIKVPTMTVDDHVNELGVNTVHVLKIDAEGYDPLVLDGASTVLRENRAIIVTFEWNPGLRASKEKDGGAHGFWASKDDYGGDLRRLTEVTDRLDEFGYDCYIDSRVTNKDPEPVAPPLYRITGECIGSNDPLPRGWANVVCAARRFPVVATHLLSLSTSLSSSRKHERRWIRQ